MTISDDVAKGPIRARHWSRFGAAAGRQESGDRGAREIKAANGIAAAPESGAMPLDVILAVMRAEQLSDDRVPSEREFNAAIAAAPHLHPGLSAAMIQADVTSSTSPDGRDLG
jgi:hypothetical protein